jgi:hypothetical protein
MSKPFRELELPFIASIPYRVQADNGLPDACKIYLGQLIGLSKKFGYCWATDQQLAFMKETSIGNIKRWNKILVDAGYIVRETKNVPVRKVNDRYIFVKRRKIHITKAFEPMQPLPEDDPFASEIEEEETDSNNVCGSLINETSLEGLISETSLEGLKSETYNNKPLSESLKLQLEPKAVVVFSLDKLSLTDRLKAKISKEYSIGEIDLAVKRTLEWKTRPNDEVAILTTLKRRNDWNDVQPKEELMTSNHAFLRTFNRLDGTKINHYNVCVCPKHIEFNGEGIVSISHVFKIDDLQFKKKLTEFIEKLKAI